MGKTPIPTHVRSPDGREKQEISTNMGGLLDSFEPQTEVDPNSGRSASTNLPPELTSPTESSPDARSSSSNSNFTVIANDPLSITAFGPSQTSTASVYAAASPSPTASFSPTPSVTSSAPSISVPYPVDSPAVVLPPPPATVTATPSVPVAFFVPPDVGVPITTPTESSDSSAVRPNFQEPMKMTVLSSHHPVDANPLPALRPTQITTTASVAVDDEGSDRHKVAMERTRQIQDKVQKKREERGFLPVERKEGESAMDLLRRTMDAQPKKREESGLPPIGPNKEGESPTMNRLQATMAALRKRREERGLPPKRCRVANRIVQRNEMLSTETDSKRSEERRAMREKLRKSREEARKARLLAIREKRKQILSMNSGTSVASVSSGNSNIQAALSPLMDGLRDLASEFKGRNISREEKLRIVRERLNASSAISTPHVWGRTQPPVVVVFGKGEED